ncbi:MAG: Efflux transporter, family, subunit [Verrucomicrobiales bacterium]|nr:Efflux transporter, family, subunit [Verrucomicrobiales bacterium]MDB6129638.1 Efflux transporter, family, subunit [Verrucomicrobiales bacterium]
MRQFSTRRPCKKGSSGSVQGTVLVLIVLLGLVGGGAYWFRKNHATPAGKPGAGSPQNMVVPVVIGKVMQKDVPYFLEGIGTVQPFNIVTVRARVDGQVQKINFKEGQDIKAGDLLAKIDPAPFLAEASQAEAKKAQDQAQLKNAQDELKRDESLLKDKILSEQAFEAQKSTVDQLTAAVKADDAAIQSARVQLDYTTITAPISGKIGLRLVDEGNIVHANDANGIVVITQIQPISIVFTLPEQYLDEVQTTGQDKIVIQAIGRDNNAVIEEGKLTVIDNQIDSTTATIRFKGTFENKNSTLWPGRFVNVRVVLRTIKNGLVVPASVVQRGPDGTYAFVVEKESTNTIAKIQPIKVGKINRGEALIEEGLAPGQEVVVDGQFRLQAGSKIKPAETAKRTGPPAATSGKPGVGKDKKETKTSAHE